MMSELKFALNNVDRVLKKLDELDEDMHGACDECLMGFHENCLISDESCKCSENSHKRVLN
ncbi:MAG: hypothetical protein GKS07_07795 [Nitrosopumilus sp.]|nr:MAG: hypothetical protein GKS07_07795 [Nitrosopumilus sp.]